METCNPSRLNRKSSSFGRIVYSVKIRHDFCHFGTISLPADRTLDRRKEMVAGKTIRGFVELSGTFHVKLAAARAPRAKILVEQLFEFPIRVRGDLQTAVLIVDFRR